MSSIKSDMTALATGKNPIVNLIETAISPQRFALYVKNCNGNSEAALRLYSWNTAIGAAFYGPLQALEVTLRNALNNALTERYGKEWYDDRKKDLDSYAKGKIRACKRDNPPNMVASLYFGFWVSLLDRGGSLNGRSEERANYEYTLWRPALWKAFPNAKLTRRQAHAPLQEMRKLRNRIAHHEAIYQRDLKTDYESILKVLGWISPDGRKWVEESSRIPEVLKERHESGIVKF